MKLKEGDIFTIPINPNEIGFGQIVSIPKKDLLIISVFDLKENKEDKIDINKIINSKIIFLGYTLDAKLYHKHWVIIGDANTNLIKVKLPINKFGTLPNDAFITDFKGRQIRKASEKEFNALSFQTVIAPVRYENALKAFYKFQDWIDADYNKLLYVTVLRDNEMIN